MFDFNYLLSMLEELIQAALRAGCEIMKIYNSPETDWQVERKADNSPLTLADRRSHDVIAEALAASPFPMLSEEGEIPPYEERSSWTRLWIVDPLDGTKEFLKRNGVARHYLCSSFVPNLLGSTRRRGFHGRG